jgi:hypothetical protein
MSTRANRSSIRILQSVRFASSRAPLFERPIESFRIRRTHRTRVALSLNKAFSYQFSHAIARHGQPNAALDRILTQESWTVYSPVYNKNPPATSLDIRCLLRIAVVNICYLCNYVKIDMSAYQD